MPVIQAPAPARGTHKPQSFPTCRTRGPTANQLHVSPVAAPPARMRSDRLRFRLLLSRGRDGHAADTGQVAPLPARVQPVWRQATAWRQTTPTRERVGLNGLWCWQPVADAFAADPHLHPPLGLVQGLRPWPGITEYMQKDSQRVHAHPDWKDVRLREVTAAWYEREVTVPAEWRGRCISLDVEYLNSLAQVFVDGRKVGELRFPAGELDVGPACQPGWQSALSLLVVALPLQGDLTPPTPPPPVRSRAGWRGAGWWARGCWQCPRARTWFFANLRPGSVLTPPTTGSNTTGSNVPSGARRSW